jgi:hypothetical protein
LSAFQERRAAIGTVQEELKNLSSFTNLTKWSYETAVSAV